MRNRRSGSMLAISRIIERSPVQTRRQVTPLRMLKLSLQAETSKRSTTEESSHREVDLWEHNYYTKLRINAIVEENKNYRAKVWNLEKECRLMVKQLESWGMMGQLGGKPFIDSSTLEKVFRDYHYSQYTLKQQLLAKQVEHEGKQLQIDEMQMAIQQSDQKADQEIVADGYKRLYCSSKTKGLGVMQLQEMKMALASKIETQIGLNKVISFQAEVQEKNHAKKLQEHADIKARLHHLATLQRELEADIKHRAPYITIKSLETRKAKGNRRGDIGRIKSIDEILVSKQQLVEEQQQKIETMKFQWQELARSCILEKQDLLKVHNFKQTKQSINVAKEEYDLLQQMLLDIRSRIVKFQVPGAVASDLQNHA